MPGWSYGVGFIGQLGYPGQTVSDTASVVRAVMLVFSVMVVIFDSSNPLAFGLAFFVLMIGIMLVIVAAVDGLDTNKKNDSSATRTEVVREIVKVRCKYCNALNLETSQRGSNCGGQL